MSDVDLLIKDLCKQCGGVKALSHSQLAIIRRLAVALSSDDAPTSQITSLMALLPLNQQDGGSAISIFVEPRPTLDDAQVAAITAALRAFNPSAEAWPT
jgi:hypothetical protein